MDLDKRISILGLSENRVSEIESLEFESIWIEPSIIDSKEYQDVTIEVDNIVGICNRMDTAENWVEMLDGLHKMRSFNDFEEDGEEIFDEVLLDPDNHNVPFPAVICHDGKLYINGEGKHRLTMAKCIGGKKARVYVGY